MARPFHFGISRSNGGPNLLAGAREFAEVLASELKHAVTVAVSYDYEDLLKNVTHAAVELAWLPPLLHARAATDGGQLVAVSERGGSVYYRSALLVRSDGAIQTLDQLSGLRAAWVDPSSSSGYLFPRLHLRAAGLGDGALATEKFLGSAANGCRAVVNGEADVCACFLSAAADCASAQAEVERTFGAVASRLRVLAVTEPIPPDGFVIGAHLERDEKTTVSRTLLGLHQGPSGQQALRKLLQAERLVAPNDALLRQLSRMRHALA